MDKKKTLKILLTLWCAVLAFPLFLGAQTPASVQFCDLSYSYGAGNDTVKIFFNVRDNQDKRITNLSPDALMKMLVFSEDGKPVPEPVFSRVSSGVRIPADYTFSILLDRSIPEQGKVRILKVVRDFIETAPDSSVFVSFYGDGVSGTVMASRSNIDRIGKEFLRPSEGKAFYSGICAKLAEFSPEIPSFIKDIRASGYVANPLVCQRAAANPGKNWMMVFAEGSRRPDDEELYFVSMVDYQAQHSATLPRVYAFYYTADGQNPVIDITLENLVRPKDAQGNTITPLVGKVNSSADMEEVLKSFQTVIDEAAYDYCLTYRVAAGAEYAGNVSFEATSGYVTLGETTFTIGSAERPWPERPKSTIGFFAELLVAVLVTLLTFALFFMVMKILVPWIQSLMFKKRYYRKYQPEANIQRRICHYCKQELRPGQTIVARCQHWMHSHCWEENGFKCAEFGQNCKVGIQNHVEWGELFRLSTLRECSQTIAGILAGFISWIIYELCGRGGFSAIARFIVSLVFDPEEEGSALLFGDCVSRTESFLMIGLLLGFFISLVFRYKDDIRDRNLMVWCRIIGLSALSGVIGMIAFGIGADLFCLILSWTDATYISWYCSLPAYVLFSISISLSLTIRSSIPVRSALLGGTISSLIGFLILYFTRFTGSGYQWLNMLLNFVIYGGGLGASLVTARMLAERYFLVIQNGVKAGQRIPIHKWMNATGGGNKVSVGMTGDCEIQMTWEKSNRVAKEHAQLYIDHEKMLPVIKPLATGVLYNSRAELPVNRPAVLSNGDTFKIGDTIFRYEEA